VAHPPSVVGEISQATLKKELGQNLAFSALSAFKGKCNVLIPDLDRLMRGDIILSRSSKNRPTLKSSPVVVGQRILKEKDFSIEASSWRHAMVYVGNMFVAEAQPFSLKNGERSGLKAVPLTHYCIGHDLIICRNHNIPDVGDDIAQYAILNYVANKRSYPHWRTVVGVIRESSVKKNLQNSANCSEFALECLAIAGACLVDTYKLVEDGKLNFYPADFYGHQEFEMKEMQYLKLVG
jgi:hypothetical protein